MVRLSSLLVFTFLTVTPNWVLGQEKEYNLSLTEWDFARLGGGISEWLWPSKYKVPKSDSGYLQKKWHIQKHQVYEMPIQRKNNGQNTVLNFLAAMIDAKKGIVIMDVNRNAVFSDDSVYVFTLPDDEREMEQRKTAKPTWYVHVQTDSLLLRDTNNNIIYKPCNFYIRPEVSYGKVSKEPSVKLFATAKKYFSVRFTINNREYEMAFAAHPVNQLFYTLPRLTWGISDLKHYIWRLDSKGIADSVFLVQNISVFDMAEHSDEYPVIIDGHHLKITKHNEDYTQITMSFEPYVPLVKPRYNPDTLFVEQLEGRAKRPSLLLDTKSQYTVLFFSGSWCLPCKQVLPAVKQFYQKYGKQVKLKTILAEASPNAAVKYATARKVPWQVYYIPVSDKVAGSVQQLFQVTAYPTFVLIDKNRQIVERYTAAEGLAELETKLKALLTLQRAGEKL